MMRRGQFCAKRILTAVVLLAGVLSQPALLSSAPVDSHIVQDVSGYNSWPMMQAIGGKLVCTYSRGSAHSINEDARAVYARTSTDGGATWTAETVVANTPGYGEVTVGKGLDSTGAMLLWVRRIGKDWNHDLYRSTDGVTFDRVATPKLKVRPMQITDVFSVPDVGLMCLWFAGNYKDEPVQSWGLMTSDDDGATWTQRTVESGLTRKDWPTEPAAVYLGDGRILAIARTETGPTQFQMVSTDYGKTWKRGRTNIGDVKASTPSLILDPKTGLLSNYYYERGRGVLRRRVVDPEKVFNDPKVWPNSEPVAFGSKVTFDSGNANATVIGDTHFVSFYSGKAPDTSVVVSEVSAPMPNGSSAKENANGSQEPSRTDTFETKIKLLEQAWKNGDFNLARSLTHSLRDTVKQTQLEKQSPGQSLVATSEFLRVDSLGAAAKAWAQGWSYCKALSVEETAGEARKSEPVEVTLGFPANQTTSLTREIRMARIDDGQLVEVPCQVHGEVRRGEERFCKIIWMADSLPKQKQQYLVFYGNPDAELPRYPSELKTEGEGFGLDITNSFFKVSLSKQTGQIERLISRREHGLELYSGGEGHGEPPGIDWAHDYVDHGHFQKFRVSLWETCPDYEVIRGPLCTIVRRWGFPYSPVHPVYSPARLNVYVEYRFYAGLPWFHKFGSMKAVQELKAAALRDDEWVFTGQPFTERLWMSRDGKLRFGDVDAGKHEDLWGVGFVNKETKDSFMALFLEHTAKGLPELKHAGVPLLFYRWHGHVWSRYPLPVDVVPEGAVLRQKNAYLSIPFDDAEGKATIEKTRRCMMSPLVVAAHPVLELSVTSRATDSNNSQNGTSRLARPGEGGEAAAMKKKIWEALRDCKDAQLYTADINVVELGLVYDVRVRGDVVTLVMAMPHRGRPRLGYFIDGSISVHPTLSVPVRERLLQVPGVRQVAFEQTWQPGWSSNRLTNAGRKKLGLE